jgi:hypothetical protein
MVGSAVRTDADGASFDGASTKDAAAAGTPDVT